MKNLLRLLVITLAVVLPHALPLPFNLYSVVIIALVYVQLKFEGSSFANVGFSWKRFEWKVIPIGVAAAVLLVSFSQLLLFPLLDTFISFPETEVEMYNKLDGNVGFYAIMLTMGWLIGGVYEEIVFHGYIYVQLKKVLPGKSNALISFALTSVLFGAYHLQLGYADTLNAFLVGMGYHLLALRFKGNLWYSIIGHGTYNTIVITLLYLGLL